MPFLTRLAVFSTAFVLPMLVAGLAPGSAHAASPSQDSVDNSIDDKVGEAMSKLKSETVSKAAYLEDRGLFLESMQKSAPLAALLSGLIGFGAGSFYAGNDSMGYTFLACEATILAVAAASSSLSGNTVVQAELMIFIAFRIADLIVGTIDASDYNEELLRRAQIGQIKMGQAAPLTFPQSAPSISVSLLSLHF
jgi:hypothetical protein